MNAKEQFIALKTILMKEIRRFLRLWLQTILPPVITTVLYFVIFGNLIGSAIGQIEGFSYIEYIVPGLIMMAVITNSYANVVSSFFSHKFQHNIEEILVSPTPNYLILLGFVGGGVVRGLIAGTAVTAVSFFFTRLHIEHIGIIISIVLLTAILFALAGFINAIYAKSFDDITIIPTFILTPLTYLGGIFYSISMLPEFWQKFSLINPILYMVNTFRYGIIGISDISLGISYSITIGFIIILSVFSLKLLDNGVGIRK